MIDKIKKLQRCKELDDEVKSMLKEVSKPEYTDYALLAPLHAAYKEIYPTENSRTRKAFVFVAIYLFCPVAFVKIRRLSNGLRCKLAKVMRCQPTAISHDYREVMFLYEHYKDFKNMVNKIYEHCALKLNNVKV